MEDALCGLLSACAHGGAYCVHAGLCMVGSGVLVTRHALTSCGCISGKCQVSSVYASITCANNQLHMRAYICIHTYACIYMHACTCMQEMRVQVRMGGWVRAC